MRRIAALLLVSCLLVATGCSWNDFLFGMFGTYHSAAYDRSERQQLYGAEVEKWENHAAENAQ